MLMDTSRNTWDYSRRDKLMTIETGILGVLISLILAVLAGGIWLGRLAERVRNNKDDILDSKQIVKEFQVENKKEHRDMITRLDKILRNGYDSE